MNLVKLSNLGLGFKPDSNEKKIDIAVDNQTVRFNEQGELISIAPPPPNLLIEEVPHVTKVNVTVTLDGTPRKITKLGKVNGTDWLVFQLETPKPLIEKNIRVQFYDNVGTSSDGGITFNHTGKVRVTTEDGSPFTPNGDSGYDNFMDSNLTMDFSGNTENLYGLNPIINFNTMTYSVDVSYRTAQTSSTLDGLGYMENVSFTAEHDEAIYKYYITSFSRGSNTPAQPEPEQPPNSSINTYLEYSCIVANATGTSYELSSPIAVQVTTSDTGGKTPQTVKFDVILGSQTRTYSYPYSEGNTYYWNGINDFNYEGQTSYSISNARVEFTDGSVSLSSIAINPVCPMRSVPD